MKKFLSLLALMLLCSVGAWANDYQPEDGQFIKLHHANTSANWYIGMNELGTTEQKYNQAQSNGIDVWKLEATSTDGQFYLFNPYCGKYLGKTGAVGYNTNISMVDAKSNAGEYSFVTYEGTIGNNTYDAFYVRDNTNSDNGSNGLHSTSAVTFVKWESRNNCENSLWLPEVVDDPSTTLLNNYKTLAASFKTKCNGHTDNVGQTFYMRNEVKALLDALGNEEPTTYNAANFLGIKANEYNLVVVPAVGTFWYVEGYHATNDVTRYLAVNDQNTLEVNDTKDNHAVWKVIASDQSNGSIQLQSVYNPAYYLNQSGAILGAYTNGSVNVFIGRKFAVAQNCVNMCVSSGGYYNTTSTETGSEFSRCQTDGTMDAQGGHSTNWKFEACNQVQTVTYTFPAVDGSIFTCNLDLANGANASTAIPAIDFFEATGLAEDATTVAADNKEFTVQGSWNYPLPFNRVMRLHGKNHSSWIVYESDSKATYQNSADGFRKDCYWYFTYAGMTASNKVMVYLHTLVNGKKLTLANANSGTAATFGNGTTLVCLTNSTNTGGFSLAHSSNLAACLNNYQGAGILKIWNDSNNAQNNDGSCFNVKTDVFDTDLANVTIVPGEENSKFLGEAPFAVDAAKKTAAKANPTPENVKAVFTPEVDVNKYYRFQCQATDRSHNYLYSDIHANTNGNVDDASAAHRLIVSKNEAPVVNTLFKFEKSGEAYYIQHVNSGKYVTGATDGVDLPFAKSSASTYEPAQVDGKWWGLKKSGTNIHLHQSNGSDGHLLVWGALNQEPASNWTIEEVETLPFTFNAATKFATFCSPVALEIPDGVKAYIATSVKADAEAGEGEYLFVEEISGVIPANTGVLLEGTASATVNFPIAAANAVLPNVEANKFVGTTIPRQGFAEDSHYGLRLYEGNAVLAKNGTVANVPANKAILPVDATPASSNVLGFRFGEDVLTAIESATNSNSIEFYDINGKRVMKPTTGIYVTRDGRKVFVK